MKNAQMTGGENIERVSLPQSAYSADSSLIRGSLGRIEVGGSLGAEMERYRAGPMVLRKRKPYARIVCRHCRRWRKWGGRFGTIHNCKWTKDGIQYIVKNDTYFPPLVVPLYGDGKTPPPLTRSPSPARGGLSAKKKRNKVGPVDVTNISAPGTS